LNDITTKSSRGSTRRGGVEHEIVLICNPQAGGRWRELAKILDSREARYVRRIVTDSIEDIGPALASLGRSAQLVCVYGGDGTIQRLLDRMLLGRKRKVPPQIAFIGGGTMNVTATWSGFTGSPGRNFRDIVRAYRSGELLLKEVPLLRVSHGKTVHLGFIFGMGIPIRVLDAYESTRKGKLAALQVAGGALTALWTGWPGSFRPRLEQLAGRVTVDGEPLSYDGYSMIFANVTGRLNPGVEPFVRPRTRDTFQYAAYAAGAREVSLMIPLLARGIRPIDTKALLRPVSAWRRAVMSLRADGQLPTDPRYVNDLAQELEVQTEESIYTVDGELFHSRDEALKVELGPRLQVAVSARVGLHPTMRLADEVTGGVVGGVVGPG
jgi:diacylglycerol kinase family enzyme